MPGLYLQFDESDVSCFNKLIIYFNTQKNNYIFWRAEYVSFHNS